jgi:hypothetical protein
MKFEPTLPKIDVYFLHAVPQFQVIESRFVLTGRETLLTQNVDLVRR